MRSSLVKLQASGAWRADTLNAVQVVAVSTGDTVRTDRSSGPCFVLWWTGGGKDPVPDST